MRRRTFIEITGLGCLGSAIAGCAGVTTRPVPEPDAGAVESDAAASPPSDAAMAHDAMVLTADPDSGMPTGDAGTALVMLTAFTVILNDTSCSGHDHECWVAAGMYADDTPLVFNGPGSHQVAFRPSELWRLQNGEQVPFATNGTGPGHGHCGLAFREGLGVPSRDRVDTCDVLPPESGPPGVCILHRQA